jgi:hypothetical protein
VRATAAAEHKRPLGQLESEREALRGERILLDHCCLRIRNRERRRFRHRLPTTAPGAWDPNEARGERSPAGVALVLRPERDRRERPALGALGAQSRQDPETLPTKSALEDVRFSIDVHADAGVEALRAGQALGIDAQ